MAGERRSSRKRAGRLRYDPQCGGDPSGVIREPAVPFSCEGSSTGAAEHALALEADWCRNAYGARQSVGLHEVTSLENPMRTITSMLCTGDGAGFALRTSRTGTPKAFRPRAMRMCDQQRVLKAKYPLPMAPRLPLWTSHVSRKVRVSMTQFHVKH